MLCKSPQKRHKLSRRFCVSMGGLVLKMDYRAFEGLLSGISGSEVAYLTYDQ